ncbi:MAG TPA: amino acid adenylation domain-containing protein [Vicinamibacterales bacterium]|nr:amino acid adenylation domain-containing protein [Vicinamibacterales bacterium]
MSATYGLAGLLERSAARRPDATAVAVPEGPSVTYAECSALSDRVRDRLWQTGVRPGDRVGMRLHKAIDGVAAIFGILKAGAAYVPVDAESPAARGAYILNDCQVKVVFTERKLEAALRQELAQLGASPVIFALDEPSGPADIPMRALLDRLQSSDPSPAVPTAAVTPDDIAYILYTSGSTGKPKGVVLTHRNALSFIDWCSDTFAPVESDTFSSHAPFHFDLSILDIYVPLKHGAKLVLIGEALGKDPMKLAAAIASERITSWYSTPSILSLLAHYGKLDRYDYSALRIVHFAGEVFPVPQFKALRAFWPHPRYFNLYGPTETNVCTYYEVPADDSWTTMDTFPIGAICEPNQGMVIDEHDAPVRTGESGELVVHGPNVMNGYWNLPEQNARAFVVDREGRKWYRTGDVVTEGAKGQYRYQGRRDRMVKRRGYRVELGEIEAALLRHPDIREAAVVAVADTDSGVKISAFVSSEGSPLSIIALKRLSSQNLPPYMIPDAFVVVDALPRTSTNKVDLQALKARA